MRGSLKKKKRHSFRKRMQTKSGKRVLKQRKLKGRKKIIG